MLDNGGPTSTHTTHGAIRGLERQSRHMCLLAEDGWLPPMLQFFLLEDNVKARTRFLKASCFACQCGAHAHAFPPLHLWALACASLQVAEARVCTRSLRARNLHVQLLRMQSAHACLCVRAYVFALEQLQLCLEMTFQNEKV